MPPRKPPEPATDTDRIIEAIRVLSGTVELAAAYLEMIADSLDKVRDEFSWLLSNHEEVFRKIRVMPADPMDEQWGAKLAAMNPSAVGVNSPSGVPTPAVQEKPLCVCDVCDKECPVEEAKKTGWIDVQRWAGGAFPYLGICPGCIEPKAEARPDPKAKKTTLF